MQFLLEREIGKESIDALCNTWIRRVRSCWRCRAVLLRRAGGSVRDVVSRRRVAPGIADVPMCFAVSAPIAQSQGFAATGYFTLSLRRGLRMLHLLMALRGPRPPPHVERGRPSLNRTNTTIGAKNAYCLALIIRRRGLAAFPM